MIAGLIAPISIAKTITFTEHEKLAFAKQCYSAVRENLEDDNSTRNWVRRFIAERDGDELELELISFGDTYAYADLKYVESTNKYAWFSSKVDFDFYVTEGAKNGWIDDTHTTKNRRQFKCLLRSTSRSDVPEAMAIKELSDYATQLNSAAGLYFCNNSTDADKYTIRDGACYLENGVKHKNIPEKIWAGIDISDNAEGSRYIGTGYRGHAYSYPYWSLYIKHFLN